MQWLHLRMQEAHRIRVGLARELCAAIGGVRDQAAMALRSFFIAAFSI